MKAVKILILIALILIPALTFLPAGETAHAVSVPHIIIGEDIWLLSETGTERLFLLPAGYYAKIENMDGVYYYVTFNGVNGKVEKNSVSTVGYHTQASGTMQELTVSAKFSDFKTIKLPSSFGQEANSVLLDVSESFIFIGEYPSTELWYYIKYGEVYGYIKAERTSKPDISIPVFIPEAETPPPVEDNETEKDDSTVFSTASRTVRILIIVGLCIPVVLLIFLLFRPSKSRKYYYEDK